MIFYSILYIFSSSDDGNLSEEHREKFDSGLELDEFDVEKSFTMAHNPQMTLSLYSHVRHLESVSFYIIIVD